MSQLLSRRELMQVASAFTVAGVMAVPAASPAAALESSPRKPCRGSVCMFSKSVPQLNWVELGKTTKEAGFDGVDLSVRSDGHVLPERAAVDLPKAITAIRGEGMEVSMLTTGLLDLNSPGARPILEIAGKLSVPHVKPGYYAYRTTNPFDDLREAGRRFRGPVKLAKENGVQIGYHNHPDWVGGFTWDTVNLLEPLDPRWIGCYSDLGHASVGEGDDEWRIAANIAMSRLKMITVTGGKLQTADLRGPGLSAV